MEKRRTAAALGAALVLGGVLAYGAVGPGKADIPGRAGTKAEPPAISEVIEDEDTFLVIDDGEVPMSGLPEMTEAAYLEEVVGLVNAARAAEGLLPLAADETLCGAARVRAAECLESFSHTRPDGRAYKTALTDAGEDAAWTGENLAIGHTTAEQVVESWLSSEGHRANILGEHYTRIGIAREENTAGRYKGYTWVQLFAS